MRIGLALSGGGLRATLYHLGVVRLLRDSDLLSQVTHVTAVSGGSVLAAHLALNWDRYCGREEDFDAAADQVLKLVSLDVRNRIVRRYPALVGYGLWRRFTSRRGSRLMTRTGLLEQYYQDYLVGNACLHELPVAPQVHLLTTNVSEGGFSSFTREQLLIQQRAADGQAFIKPYRAGLAKLATAVAASSAFPAFFPPLELRAEDIGASEGEFPTQYFSDGGIFDNLGLRVFHYLNRQKQRTIDRDDLIDEDAAVSAWNACLDRPESTALRRLAELAGVFDRSHGSTQESIHHCEGMLVQLNRLLEGQERIHDQAFLDSLQRGIQPERPRDRIPEFDSLGSDRARQRDGMDTRQAIVEAFEQSTGHETVRAAERLCDLVLASDAGKQFAVYGQHRTPGFLSTALRASDILMDRVRQLELDNFVHSPHYAFATMSDTVSPQSDPTALHPEIQSQVGRIRTDMDRFRDSEVSGLIRHGYCVARQTLKTSHPEVADRLTDRAPWDPMDPSSRGESAGKEHSYRMKDVTTEARIIQKGSRRRVWSALLDLQDWVTWIYLPLLGLLLIGLPIAAFRAYRHAREDAALTRAVAEMREDFRTMLQLLEFGTPEITPMEVMEVEQLAPRLAEENLDIISDNRITDLRHWYETNAKSARRVYVSRHVLVRKSGDSENRPGLRLQSIWNMPDLSIRCSNRELQPVVRRARGPSESDESPGRYTWEILLDFSSIAIGDTVAIEVGIQYQLPPDGEGWKNEKWWRFEVDAEPEIATSWILLPWEHRQPSFFVVRSSNENPDVVELVKPTHQTMMDDGTVLNWSVVHPRADYTYSTRWGSH